MRIGCCWCGTSPLVSELSLPSKLVGCSFAWSPWIPGKPRAIRHLIVLIKKAIWPYLPQCNDTHNVCACVCVCTHLSKGDSHSVSLYHCSLTSSKVKASYNITNSTLLLPFPQPELSIMILLPSTHRQTYRRPLDTNTNWHTHTSCSGAYRSACIFHATLPQACTWEQSHSAWLQLSPS